MRSEYKNLLEFIRSNYSEIIEDMVLYYTNKAVKNLTNKKRYYEFIMCDVFSKYTGLFVHNYGQIIDEDGNKIAELDNII